MSLLQQLVDNVTMQSRPLTDDELTLIAQRRVCALRESVAQRVDEWWASPAAAELLGRLWDFDVPTIDQHRATDDGMLEKQV